MIYWKYKYKFGKITEDTFKYLQKTNYNIRTISYFYYILLCIIKWCFGFICIPIYLIFCIIYIICSILALLSSKVFEKLFEILYK